MKIPTDDVVRSHGSATSSASTTLDVYGHLFPDEEDRTRTAVDAMLRPNPADISRTSTVP